MIHAHAQKATAQAKLDLAPHVDRVQSGFEAAESRLTQLGQATDANWESLETDADAGWHEVESPVEGALDAREKHDKP